MMQKVFWIDSLEKLEVVAKPIRIQILDVLRFKAYSPMRLSRRLDLSPQNLNYHFKLLHEQGFIYKKYEERKRGAFETFYQTIADTFLVDSRILNEGESETYQHYISLETLSNQISEQLNTFPKHFETHLKSFTSKEKLKDYIDELEETNEYHLVSVINKK